MTQSSASDATLPAAADALLRAAFESGAEADIVKRLRADRAMASEIVFSGEDDLLGYAALSWMTAPKNWLCLGPVAVSPGVRGRGVGSKVVELALQWAAERDAVVVVLGDPAYYGARGFSTERAARLTSPFPVAHTLLAGPGSDAPAETLVYPDAFREN